MGLYDHYKEAVMLISMLRNTELNRYGEALQRAVDEGAIGTEIFMALKWTLVNLRKAKELRGLVKAKADRIWDQLNRALRLRLYSSHIEFWRRGALQRTPWTLPWRLSNSIHAVKAIGKHPAASRHPRRNSKYERHIYLRF